MSIPVQQSLAGFIASDADVSFSDAGTTRVHYRVGVEHWAREQDGTFTRLDNSFHDLLIFGRTAERAADQFRKGDQFVAHGRVDVRYAEPPAQPSERETFIARRIGHDLARTTYDVQRPSTGPQPDAQPTGPVPVGGAEPAPVEAGRQVPPPPPPPTATGAGRPAASRTATTSNHGLGL